ncbi:uncharacterized protein LOC130818336 [Amaranthus tricolor]|uniref:uncharacterized protein LOC130818336 n=1 Tax=Amaranthus tricolor TaxID=29722 RepID=UPI00258D2C82|nr:uncharacterized protein LOC130818336 [Amaranthus tricolor]
MGNCLKHESQVQWGGEDRPKSFTTSGVDKSAMKVEEEELISSRNGGFSKIKEVKVKITKKELQELLGKMKMRQQGFSPEHVLGQLVKVSVHCESHHRSWRPRLQSIPEL